MSELEAVVSEDACWRQIKMTCDTTDKSLGRSVHLFLYGNSAKAATLCRCIE